MRWKFAERAVLGLVLCTTVSASSEKDTEYYLRELDKLSIHLNSLRQYAHIAVEARLFTIVNSVNALRDSVEKFPLINVRTSSNAQNLITYFEHIDGFLEFMRTVRNERALREAIPIIQRLRADLGVDEFPATNINHVYLTQLSQLIATLLQQDKIPENLVTALKETRLDIDEATLDASVGDDKARAVYRRVFALYPQLRQFVNTKPHSEFCLEIMGINDLMGAHSQVHSYPAAGGTP